jgi:5,5'-dehydrodivanillate O-demethylase
MLDAETNRLLTRVGPGTAMGALLRRYWHPIAGASELDESPIKPLELFGESLVLYRDQSDNFGLLDRHCPHRGADLANGFVEKCGLRCAYHGWRFDEHGACVEQPFEQRVRPDGRFHERVTTTAYPVRVQAGLVWAYLGPGPAPCLPDWDFFHERGFAYVRFATLPCNWLQCQENAIDPVHLEWLHDNWSRRLRGDAGNSPAHLAIDFREFEHGFTYARQREGSARPSEDPAWTIGRVCLWPNGFVNEGASWRVPIDDENTLYVLWDLAGLPGARPFEQTKIPSIRVEVAPPSAESEYGEPDLNQDFAAMLGQGKIADRSREHLGESDRGVILFRQRLMSELESLAAGRDPKGILRDESKNRRLELPRMPRDPNVVARGALPGEIRAEIERLRAEYAR